MAPPYILISILVLLIILFIVFLVIRKNKNSKDALKHVSIIQFIAGICVALIGAGIMFHGNIFGENNSGIATVIGIIGIGLIATSYKFRLLK